MSRCDEGPRLLYITPRGERIVDPWSILLSERAQQHLRDIKGIVPGRAAQPEEPHE